MSDYIGQYINDYHITQLLGEGSFAEVYLGENIERNKRAAVKILHTHINDQEKKANFLKEAHLIAELKHPNIVQLLSIGFIENTPYIIMGFASKGTLRQKHPEGSLLPEGTIAHYVRQIAAAIQYAHYKNIIHCDIKPENILINDDGNLILTDFGIAHIVQSTRLLSTHNPEGTPTYMAPEQFRGKPTKKSDQYGLGVMIFEWLCGERPFQGKNFLQLMDLHQNKKPPSLKAKIPSIHSEVEAVVMKALEKDPKKRFESMLDFANALEKAFHAPNISNGPAVVARNVPNRLSKILKTLPKLRNAFATQFKDGQNEQEIYAYSGGDSQRQLFTALDIGTAYAKALIFEVQDEIAVVLGSGRSAQSYHHMSDGVVIDIHSVIENCNQALLKAEESAGGIVAPPSIIGIAGELVKGNSIAVAKLRSEPMKLITPEELDELITVAQLDLYKAAKERITAEIGYSDIEVRLTNASIISAHVDGQSVHNPIDFAGRHLELTVFSSFAPLMQLSALETVARGLDLTLLMIVAQPYALARCLSANAGPDNGAIFIDIGGGTTDIALVRQGGVEETRMFAMGGRTFTRCLALAKELSMKEAEKLKLLYSSGTIVGVEREEVRSILAPNVQTWMEGVALLIDDLAKNELLPPAIYLAGGGSGLTDLREKLMQFPWKDRLPFSRNPIIETIQPHMVEAVTDPYDLLKDAQDITPMALAYQAVELQDQNNVLEEAITRVIQKINL